MLRMNSRWGVVMSVLALVVTFGVTPGASAQQTPRKPVTHKGTTKRSLVKHSAPVESKPNAGAGEKAPEPMQPEAPPKKPPVEQAGSPGSSDLALSAASAKAAATPPTKPKPLAPKASSKRTANPAPVGGTEIAAEATTTGSSITGPTNRVTDPVFTPGEATKPSPKAPVTTKPTPRTPVAKKPTPKTPVAAKPNPANPEQPVDLGASDGGESKPASVGTAKESGTTTAAADEKAPDGPVLESGKGLGAGEGSDSGSVGGSSKAGGDGSTDQQAGSDPQDPGLLDGTTMLPKQKALPADPAAASFHALSWSPDNDQSYIFPMAWAASWRPAADVARDVLRQPAGRRSVLFIGDIVDGMARHPDDVCVKLVAGRPVKTEFMSPWITKGIEATRVKIRDYMQQFVSAGGVLDGVVMDNETTLVAGYFIAGGNPQWEAIMADPRFPQLEQALGFSDLRTVFWGNPSYVRFNEVMGAWFDAALDVAVYQVVREFFPNATYSNYDSFKCLEQYAFPEISGFREVRDSHGLGTHDSRPYYGRVTAQMKNTSFDGRNAIGFSPYGSLLFETLAIRGLVNSRERPNHAWVAARSWTGDEGWAPTPLANSPHWDELVLQLGMHGVNQYLYWTNVGLAYLVYDNNPNIMPRNAVHNTVPDQQALNALLEELNRVIGPTMDERIALELPDWGDRAIATGRRVGDEMIWRFSFADGVESVKVFYTDGTHVVLKREPGRSGCWFSHPVNKSLVLDSDRSAPSIQVLAPTAP